MAFPVARMVACSNRQVAMACSVPAAIGGMVATGTGASSDARMAFVVGAADDMSSLQMVDRNLSLTCGLNRLG